jgi:hypothetical protein
MRLPVYDEPATTLEGFGPMFKNLIMEDHDADYVPLMITQGYLEEEQIRSFLEANGIPTAKVGEAVRDLYGFTLDGLAAASIQVPRELVEVARELLDKANRGELEIPDPIE